MKTFLKDYGIALSVSYGYTLWHFCVLYHAPLRMFFRLWLLPAAWTFYFGTVCYVVFLISIRLIKSRLIFCALSWLTVGVLFYLNLLGARSGGVGERVGGHDVFIHGHITPYGVFLKLFDPITVMAIWATGLLVLQWWRRDHSQANQFIQSDAQTHNKHGDDS